MKRWLVVLLVLVVMAFSSSALAANDAVALRVEGKQVPRGPGVVVGGGGGPVYSTAADDGGAIWPKGIWGF